jgi:hypothetical protein
MRTERFDLPLRIVVMDPLPGVALALQHGQAAKATLLPPASRSPEAVVFDLTVTVDGALPDGRPRLLGPFVQGPPAARFVYLTVGQHAGQADVPWAGRTKVPLGDIDWTQVEAAEAAPGARLTARIAGRSPEGGPALASVRLLPPGWAPQT